MSDPITENAGVIVTFYGPRGKVSGLTQELGDKLGLVRAKFGFDQDLSASHQDIFLRHFDPIAAYDTTIVQLALSEAGDACTAWETLRKKLEQDLGLFDELDKLVKKDAIWGYSLVYQAVLVEGATLDEEKFQRLLHAARRPHSPKPKDVEDVDVLAHTRFFGHVWDDFSQTSLPHLTLQQLLSGLSNGIAIPAERHVLDSHLWLLDIPNEGDGIEAATVYVALSTPDKEDELITKILYGPSAALLMPDLIAHKAYHQKRQYAGQPRKLYRKRIDESHHIIDALLDFSTTSDSTTGQSGLDKQLTSLSKAYKVLLGATPFFDNLRLSLAQQVENYEWWKEQLGQGNLAEYHYKQIQIAYREVDLLIGKGQLTLDAISTTRDLIQTQLEQKREERERIFQALITILGVALTALQLVDSDATKALLDWLLGTPSLLLRLGVQFLALLLLTALLTSLIFVAYRKWHGKT